MSAPEQKREDFRLSALLQQICVRYRHELPLGTSSVRLIIWSQQLRLSAYGWGGKFIGVIPDERTSSAFLDDLAESFGRVKSTGSNGITTVI
jgi:hypothetical protein